MLSKIHSVNGQEFQALNNSRFIEVGSRKVSEPIRHASTIGVERNYELIANCYSVDTRPCNSNIALAVCEKIILSPNLLMTCSWR